MMFPGVAESFPISTPKGKDEADRLRVVNEVANEKRVLFDNPEFDISKLENPPDYNWKMAKSLKMEFMEITVSKQKVIYIIIKSGGVLKFSKKGCCKRGRNML